MASAGLLQQRLDELAEMMDLLQLAPAVLIHLAVAGEDVQFFQKFGRLTGFDFVHVWPVVDGDGRHEAHPPANGE